MKKWNIIIIGFLFTLTFACKDEEVTTPAAQPEILQKQNATYIYWGGIWCSPCGTYAKPVKEALHADPVNKDAVFVSCQLKNGIDPFASVWLDTIANFYYRTDGSKGAPTGWIGGGTTYTRIDFPNDREKAKLDQQKIMNDIYKQTALVNGLAYVSVNAGTITVKTYNKFFNNCTDSFHIQVIITESNLSAVQGGDSSINKNIHDFVWRSQSGIPAYGDLLVVGPQKGQIVEKILTIPLDTKWKRENCEVNVLIWRQRAQRDKWGQFLWGTIENAYKTKL